MRKIVAILVIGLIAVSTLFSATTGTVTLVGTVPGILEISIVEESVASSLDLTADEPDLLIASITERSNKKAGYTVTLESENAVEDSSGQAHFDSSDSGNTDTLNYSMTYGGAVVSLASGSAVVTDQTTKTSGTGDIKELRVSYSGSSVFLYEDTYEDTLTFTITAK